MHSNVGLEIGYLGTPVADVLAESCKYIPISRPTIWPSDMISSYELNEPSERQAAYEKYRKLPSEWEIIRAQQIEAGSPLFN